MNIHYQVTSKQGLPTLAISGRVVAAVGSAPNRQTSVASCQSFDSGTRQFFSRHAA